MPRTALVDDRKRPKPQDVELDQSQQFDVILVELADTDAAGRVLQRHDVDQWFGGDQHTAVV